MSLLSHIIDYEWKFFLTISICFVIQLLIPAFKTLYEWARHMASKVHLNIQYLLLKCLAVDVSYNDLDVSKTGKGEIKFRDNIKLPFMKIILVSIIPLIVGTLGLMYIDDFWRRLEITQQFPELTILLRFLTRMILLLGISPTIRDIKMIFRSISENPLIFVKHVAFILLATIILLLEYQFFAEFKVYFLYLFEFIIILILFGLLDLGWWLLKVMVKVIFNYGSSGYKIDQRFLDRNKYSIKSDLIDVFELDEELCGESMHKIRKEIKKKEISIKKG